MARSRQPDITIRDRIYVRQGAIPTRHIKERYAFHLYDESKCENCPNLPGRHNDTCDGCPAQAYHGHFRFYDRKKLSNGEIIYSLPVADIVHVRAHAKRNDLEIVNYAREELPPMRRPLKFTGKLFKKGDIDKNGYERADQVTLVDQWLRKKRGIILAAPRTGKCLVGSTIVNTNHGFTRLDDLITKEGYRKTGFSIDTHRGVRKVSHTYKERLCSTVALETDSGFALEGTPEHPVLVLGRDLKRRWVKLANIKEGDYIVSRSSKNSPMWGSNKVTIRAARLLGYMTANGSHVTEANISTDDVELAHKLTNDGKACLGRLPRKRETKDRVPAYFLGTVANEFFSRHGYPLHARSRDKHIPTAVLSASKEVVHAYLSAYFSMDSGANGSNIELITASKRLSTELQVLLYHGFNILSTRHTTVKSASNSRTPTLRSYYALTISGHEAFKFVNEFPASKVAIKHGHRFLKNSVRKHQETAFFIPHLPEAVRKGLKLPATAHGRTISGDCAKTNLRFTNGNGSRYTSWTEAFVNKVEWDLVVAKMRALGNHALADRVVDVLCAGEHYERVAKVRRSKVKKTVYDVTVPKGHAFTANCLVSHNTVLAAYLACELGTRTIIIAHQYELLNQFYAAFVGNKEEERPAMTSAVKYKDTKKKQVIIAKNFKEVVESTADVVICTAACLYNHIKGKAIFKKLKGKFGFMVVDEVHRLFADKFTQAVAQIPALYGLGLTATDQRLDDRDKIRHMIIGGVVAESQHVSLTPDIELLKSKSYAPSDYKSWTAAMKWVARDKVRNGEIASEVFRRLKQGHKCVAVPVETKLHMRTLVEIINDRCEDEGFEPNLAVKLEAKSRDRKEILRKANRTDEPFVVIPISRIFKDGLDLASLSCVIRPVPSASEEGKGAPMFRQGAMRCATPAKNKKQPVVVLMLDELTMFRNQMRRLFFFELLPGSKNKLYRMSAQVKATLAGIPRFITRDARKGTRKRTSNVKIDKSCLWGARA